VKQCQRQLAPTRVSNVFCYNNGKTFINGNKTKVKQWLTFINGNKTKVKQWLTFTNGNKIKVKQCKRQLAQTMVSNAFCYNNGKTTSGKF
jgi:hypothetical protein